MTTDDIKDNAANEQEQSCYSSQAPPRETKQRKKKKRHVGKTLPLSLMNLTKQIALLQHGFLWEP